MLVRIVRMTLRPGDVDRFLDLYDRVSPHIRSQPGCRRLELLVDTRYPNIVSTLSWWDDETALDAYRAGTLFGTTWAETRAMFAAPAEAWSHHELRNDPEPAIRTTG